MATEGKRGEPGSSGHEDPTAVVGEERPSSRPAEPDRNAEAGQAWKRREAVSGGGLGVRRAELGRQNAGSEGRRAGPRRS